MYSKSTGAINKYSKQKEQSERNFIVSITLGQKRNSLERQRSGDVSIRGAFRSIIRKVIRVSNNIAEMAIDIKEDTIDILKTVITEIGSKGQKSLYKDCLKIRFEECLPGKVPIPGRDIYEYIRLFEYVIL
jgi:hypothetical protein